jgi:hypothetical protein
MQKIVPTRASSPIRPPHAPPKSFKDSLLKRNCFRPLYCNSPPFAAPPPTPTARTFLSQRDQASIERTPSHPCTQNRVRGNLRVTWLLCPSPQIKNHPKTTLLPPASHTFRTFSSLKRVMVTQRKTNKSRRNRRQNQKSPTTTHNYPQTPKKPAQTRKNRH